MSPPRTPSGRRFHPVQVALAAGLTLLLLVPVAPIPGASSPGRSSPGWIQVANGGHCAKQASVIIPSVTPTGSIASGDTLTVNYEAEITKGGSGPLILYFPRMYANFLMSDGSTTVASVPPNNLSGVTTSWTSSSQEEVIHKFTGNGAFAAGATAELTSELLAVMANDNGYESYNVSIRWSWTLVTASGTVVSPWTGLTDQDQCPSDFWPAPRVTLIQDSNTEGPPGTIFSAELGGYVPNQYFFLEIETPSGHVVYSQATTAGPTSVANVTIAFDCWCGRLTPGPYLTHIHNLMGSLLYSVSVLVTNPDGLSANATSNVTMGPNPVSVAFTAIAIPGVAPYTFRWSFGDGTSSTQQDPEHTYTQIGNYSANLTIRDANGETATTSILITDFVPPNPLVASVTANVTHGTSPLHVQFGSSITGGLSPYHYAWSFGENHTSNLPSPTETFFEPGFYIVVLNVTDRSGVSASAFVDVTVRPAAGGYLVAVSPGSGHHKVPATVEFKANVSGGVAPYTILWRVSGANGSFSGAVVNYTFDTPGNYTVSVNVTDHIGDLLTKTVQYTVFSPFAVVLAEVKGTGAVGTPAVIVANVTGGGPITGYHWELNGVPSPINTTRFSFTSTVSGSYAVSLRVDDLWGDQVAGSLLVVISDKPFGFVPPPSKSVPSFTTEALWIGGAVAVAVVALAAVWIARARRKRPPALTM